MAANESRWRNGSGAASRCGVSFCLRQKLRGLAGRHQLLWRDAVELSSCCR
jgi:hypothetical protein